MAYAMSTPLWSLSITILAGTPMKKSHFGNALRAGETKSGKAATVGKPLVISETGAGGIFE